MDCPSEWPEPLVRVQSISECGLTVIPTNYIKPPSQRPVLNSGLQVGRTVPVIDIAALVSGATDMEASIAVQREISEASKEWGFFQVVNHGVSSEIMERARKVWREFFYLPLDTKEAYTNTPKDFQGYGSRLGIHKGAILDWGDYYFLHLLPQSLKNHDKWPNLPSSLRNTIEAYGSQVVNLCDVVTGALSGGLGLECEFLRRALGGEDAGASLRVNYYPKCPRPDLTLGLSAHSDPGALTILLPDDHVRGLQVRKGDEWITVQSVPHAFIVNIGDQIQVLSNAIYKSVEHRVIVNSREDRLSIAMFYNPKGDILIKPAQELVAPDRPPVYKSTTFDEYRMNMRKSGPSGKSHVESLKAM